MTHERLGDRTIEVAVPEELFREMFPDGAQLDAVTQYILETNSEDASAAFLASGIIDEGMDVDVTFVPVKGLPKDSNLREVRYTEVFRDAWGNVIDIREETGVIDWTPNHDN